MTTKQETSKIIDGSVVLSDADYQVARALIGRMELQSESILDSIRSRYSRHLSELFAEDVVWTKERVESLLGEGKLVFRPVVYARIHRIGRCLGHWEKWSQGERNINDDSLTAKDFFNAVLSFFKTDKEWGEEVGILPKKRAAAPRTIAQQVEDLHKATGVPREQLFALIRAQQASDTVGEDDDEDDQYIEADPVEVTDDDPTEAA